MITSKRGNFSCMMIVCFKNRKRKRERENGSFLRLTLSFLSCLAYGKHGMTAVTRDADAILHAFIMISSSMRLSLISPEPD